MATKHQGWESTNSEGAPEWQVLEEMAGGTHTTSSITDILNHEFNGLRPARTVGSVRKKMVRMGLLWRKPGAPLPDDVAPIVNVITEPRVRDNDMKTHKDTTALIAGCIHAPYHDSEITNLVLKFANEKLLPNEVYLNGDIFDMYTVSKYSKVRERKNQWSLWDEVNDSVGVKEAFDDIKSNERTHFMEGNHEDRVRRYLIDRAPELTNFPALSIPELFGIDMRNYWSYRGPDNHVRNNLLVTHGDIVRQHSGYSARAHVEKYGMSVIHNHTHRGGSYFVRRYGQQLAGYENFCLADMNPDYISHPNWQHGFSVLRFSKNNQRFYVIPVPITGGGFMWEGERWSVDDLTEDDWRV